MTNKKTSLTLVSAALLFGSVCLVPFASQAESLQESLSRLAANHASVQSARASVDAERQRARVALGDWFPTLDLTANYGHQKIQNPNADDTDMVPREADLTVTQKLWDFGATNASLRIAKYNLENSLLSLDIATQDILLAGISAYLNVYGNRDIVAFAKKSVENIVKQSEIESALVEAGKGYSTNVLEAEAKRAEAESRLAVSEGDLRLANNEYYRVFGEDYVDEGDKVRPKLRLKLLPAQMDEAIYVALADNPALKAEVIKVKIAEQTALNTKASSFYPKFEAIAEAKYQYDVSGTEEYKRDLLGKIEMNIPFNLGLTAINSLRASRKDQEAAILTYQTVRSSTEKTLKDAWSRLETKTIQLFHLRNAVELSTRFLELARQEYLEGGEQRTLIELLDSEVALFSSLSSAAKAETDQAIAFYGLIRTMGRLDTSAIIVAQ